MAGHDQRRTLATLAFAVVVAVSAAGCMGEEERTVKETSKDQRSRGAVTTSGSARDSTDSPARVPTEAKSVVGTRVAFTSNGRTVTATITDDTPATRDLLSMLPLTVELEDLSNREKIAYLPRKLRVEDTPGFDPEDGDLIYFTPWGNLGFYYDASGIEYSDATLKIGTYEATRKELDAIEGGRVRVSIADPEG